MENSINVYWAYIPVPILRDRDLLLYPPISLLKSLKNNSNNQYINNLDRYLQCPAATNELKNTFIIKSDISFKFGIDGDIVRSTLEGKYQSSHEAFIMRDAKLKACDLNMPIIFFSEDSLEISQIPAYLSENDFVNNTKIFPGKFNISKWFRPIQPSIITKKNVIDVQRGDDLYYIKFHTNKKVILKEFTYNDTHDSIMHNSIWVKLGKPNTTLNFLYNLFLGKKYHKTLLKSIKNNLR